jgi:hypothetical protein
MIVRLGKKLCTEKILCMTPLRLSDPALSQTGRLLTAKY